jgi:hypothetical protein
LSPAATHWSRACAERVRLPDPRESVHAFVDGLGALLQRSRYDALIPGSDASVLAVSENRGELEPFTRLGLPSREVVRRVVDKVVLLDAAAAVGLASPASRPCADVEEADAAAAELGFPVVVKPVQSFAPVNGGLQQRGVSIADDSEALADGRARLRLPVHRPALRARPVPLVHGCLRRRPAARAHHLACTRGSGRRSPGCTPTPRRSRLPTASPSAFVSCSARSDGRASSSCSCSKLADRLAVIDLNPRVFASILLDADAGANLAAVWVDWLLGRDPAPVTARPAMRYRWEEGELCHFAWQLRHRRLRAAARVLRPHRRVTHAWFRASDPGPLLARGLNLVVGRRAYRRAGVSVAPETRPHPTERSGFHPLSWLERRAAAFAGPRDQVGWLVLAGRVILICLPVYFLFIQSLSPIRAVFATTVVSAVWTIGLRTALSAYFTLGPAVASAVGTITGLVAISALDLWVPDLDLRAAGLAEAAVAVFLLSAAWEHVVRSIAKRRVLVVGTGGCASDVLAELNDGHRTPFTMLGLVGERPEGTTAKVPQLGSFEELSEIVAEQRPDIVILTDEHVSSWAVDPLLDLAPAGFRVVGVSHFIEHALGRVPLRHLTPTWFMSMLHLRQKPYTRGREACLRSRDRLARPPAGPPTAARPRPPRTPYSRPGDLPANASRRGRAALHDLQVPDDAR